MPPVSDQAATDAADPRSAAVTFVTTEHFVLQGARSATIAESNGRANMFLAAVSGGLVALGLVATASSLGSAFYGFALVLLPTLAFVGFVTFERALQSSIEDTQYARRIALLRGYYFGQAPEIAPYLLSVPPAERLHMQRVPGDRWQGYRTVAGMVAVITAVLAGSTAGPGGDPDLRSLAGRGGDLRDRRCASRLDRDDPLPGFGLGTRRRRAAEARRGLTAARGGWLRLC